MNFTGGAVGPTPRRTGHRRRAYGYPPVTPMVHVVSLVPVVPVVSAVTLSAKTLTDPRFRDSLVVSG